MGFFETSKALARAIGLSSAAGVLASQYATLIPKQRCVRGGVRWDLDLQRTIDYGIYLGGWEPETLGFLKRTLKQGNIVVEVGANIGAHTLPIANIIGPSGKVYAFEAAPYALTKLTNNIALNPRLSSAITVVDRIVTSHDLSTPILDLKSAWRRDGAAEREVPSQLSPISIDSFIQANGIEQFDLFKIDVDGYDFKVISGAEDSIHRFRPVVLIELCEYTLNSQGDSVRDIFRFFNSHGYESFFEDGNPLSGAEEALQIIANSTSINGVFMPPKRS